MDLKKVLVDLICDIEKNSSKFHCYPYLKTMRSILTAAKKSPIAPHFSDKYYYGIYNYLSLTKIEEVLTLLCEEDVLTYSLHHDKKRYSIKNKELLVCENNDRLSEKDLREIDELFNDLF